MTYPKTKNYSFFKQAMQDDNAKFWECPNNGFFGTSDASCVCKLNTFQISHD